MVSLRGWLLFGGYLCLFLLLVEIWGGNVGGMLFKIVLLVVLLDFCGVEVSVMVVLFLRLGIVE